jgi:small-conductance mechanosensitive channel
MTWQNVQDAVVASWEEVISRLISFIPNLVAAIVILVVGWIVAILLDRLFDRILRSIGLQDLFESIKLEDLVSRTGIELDTTALLGRMVKWIVLIVAFLASAEVLGLESVAGFFDAILAYVPNVIVAVAVLVIAAVLAQFLAEVVRGSLRAGNLGYADFLSGVVRWSIWVFAILIALNQLGVARELIQTLFTGFVAMVAIAGGLAFGLGGQDHAQNVIESIKKGVSEKEEADFEEGTEEEEIEL